MDKLSGDIKMFGGVLLLIVVMIGGFAYFNSRNTPSVSENSTTVSIEITDKDYKKGATESDKVLVEFGDFQCPACRKSYTDIKRLVDEKGDSFTFVFKHFPLMNIHPQALLAAFAAESAGQQGKFWEMHDILYDKQTEWSGKNNAREMFEGYAQELGLDIEKFKSDMNSDDIRTKINADIVIANQNKVDSTPSFFLNNSKVVYTGDYESLKALIQTD